MSSISYLAPRSSLRLAPYHSGVSETIASWARARDGLHWLAPGTTWPLTAEKVEGWGAQADYRFVMRGEDGARLVGYGELNRLGHSNQSMWLGHLVVDPMVRGRGFGLELTVSLVEMAFERFGSRRVVLLVFPENRAAVRCYERVGFEYEGDETRRFEHLAADCCFQRLSIGRDRFTRMQAFISSRAALPLARRMFG